MHARNRCETVLVSVVPVLLHHLLLQVPIHLLSPNCLSMALGETHSACPSV